jgi:ubiquinone biosynthesis protein
MNEQLGRRAFTKGLEAEAPYWARTLPQLPRLVHQALARPATPDSTPLLSAIIETQRQQNRLLGVIALLLAGLLASLLTGRYL